jgi:hypothetical protein
MAYCSNCGAQIADNAKFCQECGSPNTSDSSSSTERQQEYAGKILKCPSCGETLKSFNANCPACGYELRGSRATNSVRELALKLEAAENRRERKANRPRRSIFDYNSVLNPDISKTDEYKATIISTFPIPNTKEDLIEFMVLAGSNIDYKSYENNIRTASKVVSDAWKAKLEQAYQKAEVLFKNDPDFQNIQTLHQKMTTSINTAKISVWKTLVRVLLIFAVGLTMIMVVANKSSSRDRAREVARLEAIVEEVESNLEEGKYKLALTLAESLEYGSYDDVEERAWNLKREYLIEQIIEEAAENGIELQRTQQNGAD